jgi:hypothetical protein
MNADTPSGVSFASPDSDRRAALAQRRRNGLALVTYWVEAGVASTAAGAWASAAVPGRWRVPVWAGVTTVLAAAALWVAEPAIALLSRYFRAAGARRSDGS